MSDFDSETIRDVAYMLAGKGKFNIGQFVHGSSNKSGYCSRREFDAIFTEKDKRILRKTSSISQDTANIKNIEVRLDISKYYPESTFLNDVDEVLACNQKKPVSERINADYVLRRCLEIKKKYYEAEIRKIESGAEIKKAGFEMKKAGIEEELKKYGI